MKKLKCHECNEEFEASSREDMLNLFYRHYMGQHKAVITSANEAEKKAWMAKFEKDWSEAEVIGT